MKELSEQLKQMTTEMNDLEQKINESCRGLKEQVVTILSMPPPRVLYQGQQRGGQEVATPPGRSTLQAPQRGGQETRVLTPPCGPLQAPQRGGQEARVLTPPRGPLQAPQRGGQEARVLTPPRGTLQAPQRGRGRGHERKSSGDRRSRGEERKGFNITL